jgi:hypothetical protein
MNTVAGVLLGLLAIIVWNNYRAGTLGQWARAKFFNQRG